MRPEKQNKPTHALFKDLTGDRYGKLVVTGYWCRDGKFHHRWLCSCDCGSETLARGNNLRTGNTVSCGCEHTGGRAVERHGMHKTLEYSSWSHMISRCEGKDEHNLRIYVDRGITVCDEWRNSFSQFYADMGPMPGKGMSIDRIDPDLGYFKENCRWADIITQNRNLRTVRKVEFRGKIVILNELAEQHGRTPAAVKSMMRRGASLERALGIAV